MGTFKSGPSIGSTEIKEASFCLVGYLCTLLTTALRLPLSTRGPTLFSEGENLTSLVSKSLRARGWEERLVRKQVLTESSSLNLTHTYPKKKHSQAFILVLPSHPPSFPERPILFSVLAPRGSFSPLFILSGARVCPQHHRSRRKSSENAARSYAP